MADHFDRDRVEFLIDLVSPKRRTRVLDIGASPLEPAVYHPLRDMNGCEVWGVEPNPVQHARLVKDARPNEHYLPYAMGDGSTAELRIARAAGNTSLLEPNRDLSASLGRFGRSMDTLKTETLETKRLDDVDELPGFDLLKIDIQGGELAVFENGRDKLSSALAVISEVAAVPLYKDQPLLDDQMRVLRGLGFDLHKFLFFKAVKFEQPATQRLKRARVHRNQMIDGDAVFLRGLFARDKLETEALKHMAILADAVFESFDVAAVMLGELVSRGAVAATGLEAYVDRLPATRPMEAHA